MSDAARSEAIRYASASGLARVTLDRPPLNVLTTSMLADLATALGRAAADPAVRVIRIDAEGKAFSAGVDVFDHLEDRLPPMMTALFDLFAAFEEVPQPVVAAVHAAALGGGLEVVLGCDLVVASERATFGQPEIKLGLFAPPASVLLPRRVGFGPAAGLLLTGKTIGAAEARAIGLVQDVFPVDEFEGRTAGFVDALLALSGPALRCAKRAIRESAGRTVPAAHARVHDLYMNELMTTDDAHEGLRAFVEKRPPVWKHQ